MIISYKFNISAAVDKTITNKFLDEHLESMKALLNKGAYPQFYGDSFKTIDFDRFDILEAGTISLDQKQDPTTNVTAQKARKGGGINDKEEKRLDNSLATKGVLLNVPPGAVFQRSEKNYFYITGMSRDGRYIKYNFSNRLVAVYKKKAGFTDDQVQDELSQLGNIFNPKQLPQVATKEYDIIDEGIRAIDNEWVEELYQPIHDRLVPQFDAACIGKMRSSLLVMTILNTKSIAPVLPMTAEKAKQWLDGSKYKDIPNKVKYIVVSYDFVTKGQVGAVKSAFKNPNEEIRVIVHCGIITGGLEQYTDRLTNFWKDWDTQLTAYSAVFFGDKSVQPRNLTLYGGVPQVTEEFDTAQVCLFRQDSVSGEFTQKLDGKLKSWISNTP
jgi:hypothetical protein